MKGSKFLKGIPRDYWLPRDDKWRTLRLRSWRCKRSVQRRIGKSFETFRRHAVKMLGKRIDWNLESKREQVSANFLFFSNFLSSRFNVPCCFLFNVHLYYRVPIEPIKSRNACRKDDTSELIEDVLTSSKLHSKFFHVRYEEIVSRRVASSCNIAD